MKESMNFVVCTENLGESEDPRSHRVHQEWLAEIVFKFRTSKIFQKFILVSRVRP